MSLRKMIYQKIENWLDQNGKSKSLELTNKE